MDLSYPCRTAHAVQGVSAHIKALGIPSSVMGSCTCWGSGGRRHPR